MEDYDEDNFVGANELSVSAKKPFVEYSQPSSKQIWQDIIAERNKQNDFVQTYKDSKECHLLQALPNPAVQFLEDNVFPVLLPILENTLTAALKVECIKHQKSLFNGIDYIAERLWNMNNRYPERRDKLTNIFFIPFVQEWLTEHPRPIFPKSWIWTKEIASVKLQAYVRGHFVRKQNDVQEMRQFWKALKLQREDSIKEVSEDKE